MAQRFFPVGLGLLLVAGLVALLVEWPPVSREAPAPAAPASAPAPVALPAGGGPGFLGVVIAEGSVDVAARFDGRLRGVEVQVGDRVRRGQVLARLEEQPVRHELSITEADLRAARAEEEVARISLAEARESLERGGGARLVGLGAVSAEEQARLRFAEQRAQARLETASAQVQRHQARVEQLRLQLSEAVLTAPFDGRVSMRYLDPGALVKAGQPVVHVLGEALRKVRFGVPEEHRLEVGMPVLLQVRGEDGLLPGQVEHVAPEVDTASRLVLIIASVAPGSERPMPFGAVVRVWPDTGALAQGSP
jgi:RND family efflux transporter MFP subunit